MGDQTFWVIPIFAKMFAEMSGGKVGLPAPTQIVIDLSNFMKSYILFMIAGAIVGIVALKRYYKTPNGKLTIDRLLLRTPIFGDLIRKAAVAKFTRTLGTLITSGVPLLEGLHVFLLQVCCCNETHVRRSFVPLGMGVRHAKPR